MGLINTFIGLISKYSNEPRKKTEKSKVRTGAMNNPNYGRVSSTEEVKVKLGKQVTEEKESMPTTSSEITTEIQKISGEIQEASEQIQKTLGEQGKSIEEKIHVENVKTYRNIQAVLEEMDKKMAKAEQQEKQMESLKTYVKCTTWFSVITLVVLILYILYSLGVF